MLTTLFRRKPVRGEGAPGTGESEAHLERSIGTFQLTLFGVGATVGTGIFFVLPEAVPDAGPAVIISFLIAGFAAGLAAICYGEMASSVPVSGSSYSYSYATLGELVSIGVGACLLLEYGVSAAATAVGWSGYLNKLLDNLFGFQFPNFLSQSPFPDSGDPGWFNLPAAILVTLCCLLLIRGASESARTNTIMVCIKLFVLMLFAAIGFTAFQADHFADFAPFGAAGITAAAGAIFFSFIGLDAVSTAGDEVKNPQKAMPRAIIGALVVVITVYLLVAISGIGAQAWPKFASPEQQDAGLAVIVEDITHSTWPGTVLAAGAVISIFSVTLVVIYGQTRILFAMGRDGLLPKAFSQVNQKTMTPVWNTVIVSVVVGILAGLLPIGKLIDMVSIGTLVAFMVVSAGVIILRNTMPDLERTFKVPGYPVTPILSIAACLWILSGLHLVTYLAFAAWVLVFVAFYLLWGRRNSRLNDLTPEELAVGEGTPLSSRFKTTTAVVAALLLGFFVFGAWYNHQDRSEASAPLTDATALLSDYFTAIGDQSWEDATALACPGSPAATLVDQLRQGSTTTVLGTTVYNGSSVSLEGIPADKGDDNYSASFTIAQDTGDSGQYPPEDTMTAEVDLDAESPCVISVGKK
jgi:amino acid transporter